MVEQKTAELKLFLVTNRDEKLDKNGTQMKQMKQIFTDFFFQI